jgi:hypothetical protein
VPALTRLLPGAALVALLLVALASAGVASAQTPGYDSMDGCEGSWQRHFGVDVLILDCNLGFATAHDRAYMYPRKAVNTGVDWRTQVDFTDAVWLIDAGARGKASLIINFRQEGGTVVAELFDDVSGDGEVRYGLERGYPKSVESRFPTVKVTGRDGWWVRDGKVNYNLTIVVDGPVLGSFGSQTFVDWTETDGRPDFTTTVHDTAGIGRPHWQIFQNDPPASDSDGIVRTFLIVNVKNDERVPDTYILWPYLGYSGGPQPEPATLPSRLPLSLQRGPAYGIAKRNQAAFPPIQVDWGRSKIDVVGELVASHGYHHWYVQSLIRFGEEKTVADFESPFLFYDLAEVEDGFPDLVIRDDYYPANDPFIPHGPFHNLRYSWDYDHDNYWDYGLNVFARGPLPATVDVGHGVRVESIPYDEAPAWVVGQPWEMISMTAIEHLAAAHAKSTEGLYSPLGAPWNPYFFGQSPARPLETMPGNQVGWRTEFATYSGEPVQLYVSAVDGKLHLYGAEQGRWDIFKPSWEAEFHTPSDEVRYRSLGGPYVREWSRLTDGVVFQSLAHLSDRLIYWDDGGVQIAKGPESPATIATRPPSNKQEMQAFGALMQQFRARGDGGDLQALFDAFPEERVVMPGVRVWDMRAEGEGFRFIASVPDPVPESPLMEGLAPGNHVFTYTPAAGFTVRPATPERLTLTPPVRRGDSPTERVPARISSELRNEGETDAFAVPIAFWATREGRERVLVAAARVDVRAGEVAVAEAIWTSPVAGEWDIHASAVVEGGIDSTMTRLTVAPAPRVDVGSLLLAQGLRPFSGGAISASLTLAVAVSTGLGFAIWRAPRRSAQRGDGS